MQGSAPGRDKHTYFVDLCGFKLDFLKVLRNFFKVLRNTKLGIFLCVTVSQLGKHVPIEALKIFLCHDRNLLISFTVNKKQI